MASNYGPRFFASAVLPDRRFIIEGGEYNFLNEVRTTLGAIYDPLLDTWIAVTPPSGWGNIGDASGHRARYRRIHAQRVLHGAVGVP